MDMEQTLLEHEKQLTEHERHLQQHDNDIKEVQDMGAEHESKLKKHDGQLNLVTIVVSELKEEFAKTRNWMIFLGACVVLILIYTAIKNAELAKNIISAAGFIANLAKGLGL